MREIKFRAWNSEYMEYGGFCIHATSGLVIPVSESLTNVRDGAPVMQYTGLKDKNGKEIYEGDVIAASLLTGTGIIEKHMGTVVFEDFEYCIETVDFSWPVASWKCVESCEIIGNIYENPELLP